MCEDRLKKERRVQGKGKSSHIAGQEVFNGNALPSCQCTIHHSVPHHMTHVTSITVDSPIFCAFCMELYSRPYVAQCFSKIVTLISRLSLSLTSLQGTGGFPIFCFSFQCLRKQTKRKIIRGLFLKKKKNPSTKHPQGK